ncbi:uncharacterized protein LOC122274531 [Carya illinoinensis]|uniref:uncharacterized protein LOC122274531 n=1 Tax=Carya illinoinensis TaxID=32201 RepID=UPI001C725AF5|nr:uncharacterized protein LOC122274531 [Carya illinoinensis]
MLEVDGTASINELHFAYEPFWVQLHNLPLATMTEELGEQFAESIGNVIRVDTEADGRAWGRTLRVRVAVDIHKPLLRGKWIKFREKKHWISFKYERLQNFCFQCGVLFHKGKDCTRLRPEHRGEEEAPTQFGPWLRGQPRNINFFDSRQQGSLPAEKKEKDLRACSTQQLNEGSLDKGNYVGPFLDVPKSVQVKSELLDHNEQEEGEYRTHGTASLKNKAKKWKRIARQGGSYNEVNAAELLADISNQASRTSYKRGCKRKVNENVPGEKRTKRIEDNKENHDAMAEVGIQPCLPQ